MLAVLDAVAGASLLALGVVAWRRSRGASLWGIGAAAAWFAASLAPVLVLVHRPLLLHAIVASAPGGIYGTLPRVLLGVTWAGTFLPLAAQPWASIASAALCVGVAVWPTAGRERVDVSGSAARAALLLLSAGLMLPVLQRIAWPGYDSAGLPLATYLCAVILSCAAVISGIVTSRWRETDAVIELSDRTPAWTLANLRGLAAAQPDGARGSALAAAVGLLEENVRLQRNLAERIAEVRASRVRLVDAAVKERQRLQGILDSGAMRYLGEIEECLRSTAGHAASAATAGTCLQQITHTRDDLEQLAQGLHPRILAEYGLSAALEELSLRSPVPVEVSAPTDRFPERVETALWYACAEALANVFKHAHATRAGVHVAMSGGSINATITDDGVGGANLVPSGGLTGVADRLSAINGSVRVATSGAGTVITITVPVP